MDELVVRVVELQGNHFTFGLQQSEEIKQGPFLKQQRFLENLSAHSNVKKAEALLQIYSPNILEELKGLAKGLNMEIGTMIRYYSGYDVDFPSMGCTAYLNHDYYVRNYDFSPELYDARLVFSNPINGYASVGFSQQVIGRLDGMNEKGLVVGLHFVNNEHKGEGFLATTIVRILLEQCCCLKESMELISKVPHGFCYNYSITDSSGKSIVVEATPELQVVHENHSLICTNHFEAELLKGKNKRDIQGSLKRKEYLSGILTEKLSPIAAYHQFNDGNSPLFFKYYKEYFGTLHTVVYLPKELSVIIGVGENCKPIKLSLREYLKGRNNPPEVIKGKINQ